MCAFVCVCAFVRVWFARACVTVCGAQADKFTHLSNNSIQKYSDDFNNTDIPGNMWPCSKFKDLILRETVRRRPSLAPALCVGGIVSVCVFVHVCAACVCVWVAFVC